MTILITKICIVQHFNNFSKISLYIRDKFNCIEERKTRIVQLILIEGNIEWSPPNCREWKIIKKLMENLIHLRHQTTKYFVSSWNRSHYLIMEPEYKDFEEQRTLKQHRLHLNPTHEIHAETKPKLLWPL